MTSSPSSDIDNDVVDWVNYPDWVNNPDWVNYPEINLAWSNMVQANRTTKILEDQSGIRNISRCSGIVTQCNDIEFWEGDLSYNAIY